MSKVLNNLGYNPDLKIWQDKSMFNYSVDTILLGNFIDLGKKIKRACEVGANNGALSIFVAHRDSKLQIDAIEINKKAINLAKENVVLNDKQSQINVIEADFNDFWKEHNARVGQKYHLVFANPPYYKMDTKIIKNVSDEIKRAIYEVDLTLEELIVGAGKILDQKGRLALVLPIERYVDLLELLRLHKFEPKKTQFVAPRLGEAPKFVLVQAEFASSWGGHYLPILYLHPKDKTKHVYRKEIQKLYVCKKVKNG